jgi:hypothetical protein
LVGIGRPYDQLEEMIVGVDGLRGAGQSIVG